MLKRLIAAAAVGLLTSASAVAQNNLGQQILEREIALMKERVQELDRQILATIEERVVSGIAFARFMNEKLPADAPCGPAGPLAESRRIARHILDEPGRHTVLPSPAIVMVAAGHLMDVADIMRARSCTDDARKMYEEIFRRFPQMEYGGLRDRAAIALNGLR